MPFLARPSGPRASRVPPACEVHEELQAQPDFQRRPLSEGARSLLARHPWPGNVRELRTTLVRAAIFAAGDKISRRDIQQAFLPTAAEISTNLLQRPLGGDFDIKALQADLRSHYVERAMKEAGGIKARAARLLNVSPQTFQHWN